MNKLILFLIIAVLFVTGCSNNSQIDGNAVADAKNDVNVEKLEVYHFHRTSQCFTCRTVGAFAEKTITIYYQDLLDSGKMTFASINIDLPENKELAAKYEVSGSSLQIGTYIKGEFHKEENVNVWYKVNDEADYLSYLKGVLDKRISGDLS